jgi:hypothetical protein
MSDILTSYVRSTERGRRVRRLQGLLLAVAMSISTAAAEPVAAGAFVTIAAAHLTPIKGGGAPCPKGKWRCNGRCIPDRDLCRIT